MTIAIVITGAVYAATYHAGASVARWWWRRSTLALIRTSAASIARAELERPWP